MGENDIIKKWKPLLEWSSRKVPPLSIEKYLEVALILEKCESDFIENALISKRLIPQIRKNEGELETVIINDVEHYVIDCFEEKYAISPENYMEIHSFTTGYDLKGYKFVNGEWI
jgi:hypothetical protein